MIIRRLSSLDSWLAASAAIVIVLSLLLAILTSAVATWLYGSVAVMSSLVEGAHVAGMLRSEVLNQARLHGMVLAFGPDHYGVLEQVSRERLEGLLVSAEHYAGNAAERRLVDQIRVELQTALEERDRTAQTVSPLEGLRRSVSRLDPILASVEELQAINSQEAALMATRAARLNRLADVGAVSGFGAMLAAAGMLAWLAHRHIRRPLQRLSRGMAVDAPDAQPLLEDEGPAEVREVARAFNAVAEARRRLKKGELETLAGVVHDMKNPLAGSRMLLPVLADAAEKGDVQSVRRIVELLDRELHGLRDLTSDLLDALRVQGGALSLECRDVDMTHLVRETADIMGRASMSHRLEMSLPAEPVMLAGDERRLTQVVRNLIDNAIKYSPAGGRVRVTLAVNSSTAVLTVSDEGIGISRDEMDSLFQPFWRSARARDQVAGTGIGLSVVHRIVTAHGGSIQVDSRPGAGSSFRVALPRHPAPARPLAAQQADQAGA